MADVTHFTGVSTNGTLTVGTNATVGGTLAVTGAIVGASVGIGNDVVWLKGDGAPVDGTTGKDVAGPGSMYTDYTNKNLYINAGTKASPTWKLVTRAA